MERKQVEVVKNYRTRGRLVGVRWKRLKNRDILQGREGRWIAWRGTGEQFEEGIAG